MFFQFIHSIFCVYIAYLVSENETSGAVTGAFHGVKWAQGVVGKTSPTIESQVCKTCF